jgi:hypothetical protein
MRNLSSCIINTLTYVQLACITYVVSVLLERWQVRTRECSPCVPFPHRIIAAEFRHQSNLLSALLRQQEMRRSERESAWHIVNYPARFLRGQHSLYKQKSSKNKPAQYSHRSKQTDSRRHPLWLERRINHGIFNWKDQMSTEKSYNFEARHNLNLWASQFVHLHIYILHKYNGDD